MPHLIDFYEDHQADRDKFEILAFHDAQAKTFDELDTKLKPIIKRVWNGRPLPFPILLDSTGQTIEAFGIRAFPTMLLIDPDGKLVGEANEGELEKKLPPIPLAVRIPRAMDRNISIYFQDPTLKEAVEMIARQARVPVTFDEKALQLTGLTPETRIPLKIASMITTRSALELAFAPMHLEASTTPEGLRLISPLHGDLGARTLSKPQEACAERIREKLAGKLSFQLGKTTLEKLVQHLENTTMENFVLDPRGRKTGVIKPEAPVEADATDEPLEKALARILKPLGLGVVVRDEVVVITASP